MKQFILCLFLLVVLFGCKKGESLPDYHSQPAEMRRQEVVDKKLVVYDGELSEAEVVQDDYDNREQYDYIAENQFKSVLSDPVSTFSIDVDTAAYANVRRFIENNQLPPVDAVRIEELINYFEYEYPLPTGEHPFSVYTETATAPWNEDHQLVMIGLKGKEIPVKSLPPSNLVFLLDVSGSMSDYNKLPLLKKAFHILVDNLRPQDRVAIVVYAGASGIVLNSTSGENKKKILKSIYRLNSGGSTAGARGIELAYQVAQQNFIKNGNNRVILATDGDFNVGPSSDGELVRLIEQKRDAGVFLTILGFGMGNYQDAKMEKLSNAGNGNYAYIDTILEANKVLNHQFQGNLFTIAKDVKIQIEFNPAHVKGYRLIGYENRLLNNEDFNDDKKDAGEIGAGHTVTALYEMIPANSSEEVADVDPLEYQKIEVLDKSNLMTVKLRYKKPQEDNSQLLVTRIPQQYKTIQSASGNLQYASAVAAYGLLLRDSQFKGNATFQQVIKLAKTASLSDQYGYKASFIRLVETTHLISNLE
ncbi:MAG: VWA domain-containing protein [Spirochaetes bacterium]|nr:VWA domain-containing protein [Spirochaetota bacterium]